MLLFTHYIFLQHITYVFLNRSHTYFKCTIPYLIEVIFAEDTLIHSVRKKNGTECDTWENFNVTTKFIKSCFHLKTYFYQMKANFLLKNFTWQQKSDSSSNVIQKSLSSSRKQGKRLSSHQRTAAEYQRQTLIKRVFIVSLRKYNIFLFSRH